MKKEKKNGFFSWFKKNERKNDENLNEIQPENEKHKIEEKSESSSESECFLTNSENLQNNHENSELNSSVIDKKKLINEETINEIESKTNVKNQINVSQKEKNGFFSRLKSGLFKTKQNFGSSFASIFNNQKIDDSLFEELEDKLLIADVGINTTNALIDSLKLIAKKNQLDSADSLYIATKDFLQKTLKKAEKQLTIEEKKPFVILMVGVNGVGKTTTIGKLAKQFQNQGKSVMLAAGDTFRTAAVEQLQIWGERNNISVIAQQTGADSASVIFDALQSATAKKIDILLIDTAGRLQNKNHLMNELHKIVRVIQKQNPEAPHETMLTIDASTGQNAISQVALFNQVVPLTGITLTKMDGTAKGGIIFSLADQFSIPIRFIGIGEKIDDLRPFNSSEFIDALFSSEEKSHL